jgi:hypothetical protein
MSYYMMDYSMTDPGTPGWQFAPVPGWGVNPAAAGPRRVGVGLLGFGQDTGARTVTDIEGRYSQTSYGMVAAVGAGALLLGVFLGYVAGKRAQKRTTANYRRNASRKKKGTSRRKRRSSSKEEAELRRDYPEFYARFDLERRHKRAGTTPPGGYELIAPPRRRKNPPARARRFDVKGGKVKRRPAPRKAKTTRRRAAGRRPVTAVCLVANPRWSTKYKNQLPDSAFFYVAPGGRKVRTTRGTFTIPKSKRKLPYKNLSGRVDRGHLRAAIGRAGQKKTQIPAAEKKRIQGRAQRMYGRDFGYKTAPTRALPRAA